MESMVWDEHNYTHDPLCTTCNQHCCRVEEHKMCFLSSILYIRKMKSNVLFIYSYFCAHAKSRLLGFSNLKLFFPRFCLIGTCLIPPHAQGT
ncbi:hypothetical protein MUK42_01556 [Musa troglodytarum]|uniref:Uncharacterized protein n=1 Tax=Musa troglodytarum TaxID=320322 RepID=A0A9E7GBC0_9LILI|nr:hypothetical protein MUK42_01556 [Musa troglodytarum]